MDKRTQGRAPCFHVEISGFLSDLCRNVMGVTTKTGLGRVGGAGEGLPAGRARGAGSASGEVSPVCSGRVPAGPALFALAPPPALNPKPGCSAQPPPLSLGGCRRQDSPAVFIPAH